MTQPRTNEEAQLFRDDLEYCWHPFTIDSEWRTQKAHHPIIDRAKGSYLYDVAGKSYLDGNASIWTNIHGHGNAELSQAIKDQVDQAAHTSFLGQTHRPGILFAKALALSTHIPEAKVFYSDNGSTANETALKALIQKAHLEGHSKEKHKFFTVEQGYYGDTLGAVGLGNKPEFHSFFHQHTFEAITTMAPACYRCPFNRAKHCNTDARHCRKCNWECVDIFRKRITENRRSILGVALEPLVQGAAGMLMHPKGFLSRIHEITRDLMIPLILDEVFTGFGRLGSLFAYQKEQIEPDILCLGKGITGGTLPMAATIFPETFVRPFRKGLETTFFHGHSYCGNQLGCAAGLANLDLLQKIISNGELERKSKFFGNLFTPFWDLPQVGDVRVEGLVAAIELVQDRKTKQAYDPADRIAYQIGQIASRNGLLCRGLNSTLFLIPAVAAPKEDMEAMVNILLQSTQTFFAEK